MHMAGPYASVNLHVLAALSAVLAMSSMVCLLAYVRVDRHAAAANPCEARLLRLSARMEDEHPNARYPGVQHNDNTRIESGHSV